MNRLHAPLALILAALLLAGCSSFHPWQNEPAQGADAGLPTSQAVARPVVAAVALSGGGARAAAFGLGVLQELKATEFTLEGRPTTLLDEVTLISGVSGGSILAAHYAAFGDESLTRFEPEFLLNDFEGSLVQLALSPRRLFRLSSPWYGRSNVLADRLDVLYRGRTFGDLRARAARSGPGGYGHRLDDRRTLRVHPGTIRSHLLGPGERAAVLCRRGLVGRAAGPDAHDATQLRRNL